MHPCKAKKLRVDSSEEYRRTLARDKGDQMVTEEYVATIKVVLLGESSVGKSTIVTRFTTGEFHKNNATIGAAFTTKEIQTNEMVGENEVVKNVKFEIWDTAGQERYRSLAPMYYRNTDVAIVVFDVTQQHSKDKAQSWIDELHGYLDDYKKDDVMVRIVGNKIDLVDVSTLDTWQNATLVSAMTGEGINELFDNIADTVPLSKFAMTKQVPHGGENQQHPQVIDLNKDLSSDHQTSCTC